MYHKTLHLLEVQVLEDEVTYDDYLADFSAEFHDLRDREKYAIYLDPASYIASQQLAAGLFRKGGLGVVYFIRVSSTPAGPALPVLGRHS